MWPGVVAHPGVHRLKLRGTAKSLVFNQQFGWAIKDIDYTLFEPYQDTAPNAPEEEMLPAGITDNFSRDGYES